MDPISLLIEVVNKGGMDPWEIDIVELTERYLEVIREKEIDISESGKFILASSTLLRMKSEAVLAELSNSDDDASDHRKENEEVLVSNLDFGGEVKLMPRRTRRKMSLVELVSALREAIECEEGKKKVTRRRYKKTFIRKLSIFKKRDIEVKREIERLYRTIRNMWSSRRRIRFSVLVDFRDRLRTVRVFLYLLFLCRDGKINLEQDEMFGEVYIEPRTR
ncbi:hypothetical protein DRN52_06085 [Thermococci archaeon]|nr:MAG: hypothetical protein DRN52_06085 [Thermococci archaeon]